MPDLSFIIPVYNAEPYLEECIDSLFCQTYLDLEFIFINDGSTDNSLKILEKGCSKEERATVITQKNSGVSVARNQGINHAKGNYIVFVDADDYVQKTLCEKLICIAKECDPDLILFNIESFENGRTSVRSYNYPPSTLLDKNFIESTLFCDLIKRDDLFSPCDKLYKTQIIKDNAIEFPPGNALSEDNLFNLTYFGCINSFYYLDFNGYFYREVLGSATRNFAESDYFENQRQLFHIDYSRYLSLNISDLETDRLRSYRFLKVVMAITNIYFTKKGAMSLRQRFKYIQNMIYSPEVEKALLLSYDRLSLDSSRFEKAVLSAIKRRSVGSLFFLTKYSQFRNRS